MTAPRRDAERAVVLDVLRGFALLGIFLAHVPGFSGWDYLSPEDHQHIDHALDGVLQFLRDTLIRGKFYSLFSLLFGFGFALQLASAQRSGDAFVARFRRRQLGLLFVGVIHSLLWHGDILLKYALLGLVLLPSRNWSGRKTLRVAGGALIARALWALLMWLSVDGLRAVVGAEVASIEEGGDVNAVVRAAMVGYWSPHWADLLASNFGFLRLKWLNVLYGGKLISIFGFFALGAALGKWRWHERTTDLRATLTRVAIAGYALGIPGNALLAFSWHRVASFPPSGPQVGQAILMAVAIPALTLALAASVALVWDRRQPFWLAWFAPAGRMALTTYLSQTAIGIGVFYGVGLGWRGQCSLAFCCAFAVAVFGAQAAFAHVWLKAFRFGPAEWLWRCATYGRWLPLRREGDGA